MIVKGARITAKRQSPQSISLGRGIYTYNAKVFSMMPNHSIGIRTVGGTWLNFDLTSQITQMAWSPVKLTFALYEPCDTFVLHDSPATSAASVVVALPMLEEGSNASTHRPNELDLAESIKGVVLYSLRPSLKSIKKGTDTSIKCDLLKTEGGQTTLVSLPTGFSLDRSIDGGSFSNYTPGATIALSSINSSIRFRLYDERVTPIVMLDSETIYVISDGEDGESNIVADLDNEVCSVAATNSGLVESGLPIETIFSMYYGTTKLVLTSLVVTPITGVTTSVNTATGKVTLTAIAENVADTVSLKITGSATHNGVTYTRDRYLTINKIRAAVDAVAPIIEDGFWAFWDYDLQDYVKSEFSATGDDGHSPYILNDYWWEWDSELGEYVNTGIKAKGDKGDKGEGGDGYVILYRHSLTKPATPTTAPNPPGWTQTPDRGVTIGTPSNWTLSGNWYQSNELTAIGNSPVSTINIVTTLPNQVVILELWADGASTDYVYAGNLNSTVSTSAYKSRINSGRLVVLYDIPTAGSHSIQLMWRKGVTTISGSNRGYFSIIQNIKTWKIVASVSNGIYGVWSEATEFINDTATEERIYCLSKSNAVPIISDSDPYVDDYIPLPCTLANYRGDFTTNRQYSINNVVNYMSNFYKVVVAVPSNYTGNPTNKQYFEKIKGWTDNPSGATKEFPYEHVALRKKVNSLWGNWQISISSNYSIGNNYIPMGWFDYSIEYRITDIGIPLIKKVDGTALGFSVYTLNVPVSTVGEFIEEEWTLVESAEFLYMQQAYIEKLQGELILAREVATASEGFRAVLNSNGLKFFNEAGVMNIRIGLKNGYAVLEYYDNNGTLLYDLGPNGLKEMEIREEKWTTFKGIFLGTSLSTILNSSNRDKYKKSWNQSEVTYYVYTSAIIAGVNQDSINDGKIFTTANKSGSKIPNGYYCKKMPINGNVKYKEATNTNALINSQLPYINASNENVYDREKICFTEIEYYFSGDRGVTLTNAYWNESPESGGVVEI